VRLRALFPCLRCARSNKLDSDALCALSEHQIATAWGLPQTVDVPHATCAAITVSQDSPLRCVFAFFFAFLSFFFP
jgi:hypothetical protein